MENKQSPSKKKLISIQEGKLIRKVDYDSLLGSSAFSHNKKELLLDLEILQRGQKSRKPSQRVLVSIKPRAPVPIKTIYIAEKNRFFPNRGSDKSATRLAIGDHSSSATHFTEEDSNIIRPEIGESKNRRLKSKRKHQILFNIDPVSDQSQFKIEPGETNVFNTQFGTTETCYAYVQPRISIMNQNKCDQKSDLSSNFNKDVTTFISSHPSSNDVSRPAITIVKKLHQRIEQLERKILRQEMVFRSIDPDIRLSSSDEDSKENTMKSTSGSGRPGCSYIEQYSHVPETSAFQRYAQQSAPLSPSKATTIDKEHNSEQYGRDFTAYDGITARGRRQCASVPCKHDDAPNLAAERVHKIRHKLNPVRDYRLMDTVHYLAQGEFAPRDDGIKLTPSREAVLSDIIWEDVCRTHWPSARLGRRVTHPERCNTRGELQRLIDSLLRERVAHVERRRRRHYRIVKLNHRHESCRPVGKTGDIIVASHKNKQATDEKEMGGSEHNATSPRISKRKWQDNSPQRSHRSHDRLSSPDPSQKRRTKQDNNSPGPSYAFSRSPRNQEPTCCYRAISPRKLERMQKLTRDRSKENFLISSSGSSGKHQSRNPRLIVKKDPTHKKHHPKEEPNLESFILLPTLVIRTPSNVKRQKKFNELYHRILNVRVNNDEDGVIEDEGTKRQSANSPNKKDIGFNINITLSNSDSQKQ